MLAITIHIQPDHAKVLIHDDAHDAKELGRLAAKLQLAISAAILDQLEKHDNPEAAVADYLTGYNGSKKR